MKHLLLALALVLLTTSSGVSELKLAGVFTDHAVVQRDAVLPIWGTSEPDAAVVVSFGRHQATTKANSEGFWQVNLPGQAGSNLRMTLQAKSNGATIVRTGILLGDVWHASGQSNMAMTVGAAAKSLESVREAAADAELPEIRFTKSNAGPSFEPQEQTPPLKWTACSPTTVKSFSAVAFFFARRVHADVGVPIGIIDSSRGGTPIEPFIPRSAFTDHPTLKREAELGDLHDLKGIWRLPGGVRARDGNWLPGRLFNSRIAPIKDFAVKGCIWYQGESNCGKGEDPRDYRHKMRALIQGWRDELNSDIPFYFVQLPGSGAGPNWPYLREQQRLVTESKTAELGGVGMAVTIDLEHPDIHPPNKIAVGERLARWALFDTYERLVQPFGPVLSEVQIQNSTVLVTFEGASFGLKTSPEPNAPIGELKHFELMNEAGEWHGAKAIIDNDSVRVTSQTVTKPVAVRYAYGVAPKGCNLFNINGLPASPFCSHPEVLRCAPNIPAAQPLIIAHRGASADAPENTLEAFKLAFAQGADGVEGDFYLTSDNKIVCIHDKTTKRVAGKDLVVADSTLKELGQLDVGSWKDPKYAGAKIPRLEEVLFVIPEGKLIFIELKVGPEIISPLKEVLANSRIQLEQCVIISFNANTIAEAKRQLPTIKTHWLSGHRFDKKTKSWSPSVETVINTLKRTNADGFGSQAKPERFNADFVDKLKSAGFDEFHTWTINDAPNAQLYRELGTTGITTDRPADVRDAISPLYVAKPLTKVGQFTPGIEGPACDRDGNLYAVNLKKQGTIGRVWPDGKSEVFAVLPPTSIGNGIRFGRDGSLFVADYTNHNILRISPGARSAHVFAKNDEMNQPNDLAIASDGTLFASDPNWREGTGQLWRIDRDGTTTRLAKDMGTTNGIEVSPDDKTLYVNESKQRNIWAFDINPDKTLSNKRLFKQFPDHGFDGMRCDVDGNLYVTRHGKGTVVKLSPSGELLREIELQGTRPSNICFGGTDGRTAFVTEVDHTQVVSFRVDTPGLAWNRPAPKPAEKDETVRVPAGRR